MSNSIRFILQQFSNNEVEQSSQQSGLPKPVIGLDGVGNRIINNYSDYLIDGIPIWQVENRGMTEEEAEAYSGGG